MRGHVCAGMSNNCMQSSNVQNNLETFLNLPEPSITSIIQSAFTLSYFLAFIHMICILRGRKTVVSTLYHVEALKTN